MIFQHQLYILASSLEGLTFLYIHVHDNIFICCTRIITKRASGITVAKRPIPQLTSSNNSNLMKCDLETTRMLSHACPWLLRENFEHGISVSFDCLPCDTNTEDLFQHPMLVQTLSCVGESHFLETNVRFVHD